jgi:hypothetical protein
MVNEPIRIEILTDTERLIALGRVVANWAYFEQQMDLWLRVLLAQAAATGFPQVLNLSFKRRVRLWRDLAAVVHTESDKATRIKEIITRSATAREDRDWVVHGFWTKTGKIIKFQHSQKVRVVTRIMNLRKIQAVADEIAELIWDHTEFYQRFSIRLGTGEDVPYSQKDIAQARARRTRPKPSKRQGRPSPHPSSRE